MAEALAILALASSALLFLALFACSLLASYCFGAGLFDVGYRFRGVGHG
ncbi:hypothetical protein [Simplicispira sedimenti]|nr:hypothetical protein [Acidovorax sp. W1-6]